MFKQKKLNFSTLYNNYTIKRSNIPKSTMTHVQPVAEISQRLAARNAAQRYYVYTEEELTDDELHFEADEDFQYEEDIGMSYEEQANAANYQAEDEQIEGYAEGEDVEQIEGYVSNSATPEEEN